MNSITICGNLGKDVELKFLPSGDPIANFSVADSQGKDKQSIWWNCTIFGKRAESLSPYLTKGAVVTVVGSVSEREWTDKDGNKRKSMDVRVNDIALQGGRKEASEAPRQAAPAQRPAQRQMANDMPFDDIDIPF